MEKFFGENKEENIYNVEDIRYLEQKLIAINKMVDDNEYTIKVRR